MSDSTARLRERLTLWGRLSSCNVQKALWVLEELGLSYRRVDAGGAFGGLDDPAYRAMNPHGKVPSLRDGEAIVWESDAIIRYLAARYGDGLLWPEARARIADSAYATVERMGRGQVILFATDPSYRMWFPGMQRLLLNAVLLGPGMGTSPPRPW